MFPPVCGASATSQGLVIIQHYAKKKTIFIAVFGDRIRIRQPTGTEAMLVRATLFARFLRLFRVSIHKSSITCALDVVCRFAQLERYVCVYRNINLQHLITNTTTKQQRFVCFVIVDSGKRASCWCCNDHHDDDQYGRLCCCALVPLFRLLLFVFLLFFSVFAVYLFDLTF